MNLKQEKEKLYSRNFTKYGLDSNVFVSVVTALLVLAFSIFTIVKTTESAYFFINTNAAINKNLNWLFLVNAFLAFLLFVVFPIFGNRLKAYTTKSEFKHKIWFYKVFSINHSVYTFTYQETSVQLLKTK